MNKRPDKKPYDPPRIVAVQELKSRSGPCALTATDGTCSTAVWTS